MLQHKHLFALVSLCATLLFITIAMAYPQHTQVQAHELNTDTPSHIYLRVGTFDPLLATPSIPKSLQSTVSQNTTNPTLYLVQCTDTVLPAWKKHITALGAQLYGYIPDNTFIARMDAATAKQVAALDMVRWVGLYHPAYRLSPALQPMLTTAHHTDNTLTTLIVQALPDGNIAAMTTAIEALGGTLTQNAHTAIATYLHVVIPMQHIVALSAIDGVVWVEPYNEPTWQNNVGTGEIVRTNEIRQQLHLYGAGQTVAIMDSGLDTGNLDTLHPDVRGRVVHTSCVPTTGTSEATSNGGKPCDWGGYFAHGTHVAGTLVGNGIASGSNPQTHEYGTSFAGVAPEANLVFQATLNFAFADWGEPLREAYEQGARIHSSSLSFQDPSQPHTWSTYTTQSQQVDQAAWEHPDMLMLFAAGNFGTDADANGVVDRGSIGWPGTAKNIITVGASESVRNTVAETWGNTYAAPITTDQQANNAHGIAAFSSRGPTSDGRIKPDIVAPGTYIASLRTHKYMYNDMLEGDVSGFSTITNDVYGGVLWHLTDDAHSGTHAWTTTITGTKTVTSSNILLTPPFNATNDNLWGDYELFMWHQFALSDTNELALTLYAPSSDDPTQYIISKPITVSHALRKTTGYTMTMFPISTYTVQKNGYYTGTMDLSKLQLGFSIVSTSGAYSSTWSIDDIRLEGPKHGVANSKGLLHDVGLAAIGSSLNDDYMLWSGTSMATPTTAGAAALVREWLVTLHNHTNPSSALIKALLIHGAEQMTPGQYGTGTTQEIPMVHPNPVSGWGRLNLVNSINLATPEMVQFIDNTTGITTNQTIEYHTVVSDVTSNSAVPFQVTLVWSDYPAEPSAAKSLVNDLDLEVVAPNGTQYIGNSGIYQTDDACVRNGYDSCNSVEEVTLPATEVGTYTIRVVGTNIAIGNTYGRQPFAVVATGENIGTIQTTPNVIHIYLPIVFK